MGIRAILLIGFFVASIPICFFRPFYGILLWTIVAFLNPQSHTWDAFDAFPWALSVAIPTLLGMMVFERRFDRLATREAALLAILWIWFTITTLVSTSTPELMHHAAETWERWNFVSKILLMTLCMLPIVNTLERLRYVALTIGACFGFYIVKALPFIIATGGAHRLYGPERSMIGDNTDFGLALNMTLPLYFFLAQSEKKNWMRLFFWFMFVITIPAIFFTYSRGALVGLAAVFAVMIFQSKRRFALLPIGALGLVVALSFAPDKWQERMDLTRAEAMDNSAQSRLNAWAYARALAAEYPITGGGFSTFTAELYDKYWPGHITTVYGAHSVYFQVLAEHGYVGLALYLTVVLFALITTRRLRKGARQRGDDDIRQYATMFQVSLIGFLISGTFLGRAYFDYFFAIVACISILDLCARERWAAARQMAPAAEPAVSAFGTPHTFNPGRRQPSASGAR